MMLALLCGAVALTTLLQMRLAAKNKDWEWARLFLLIAHLWGIASIVIIAIRTSQ